MKMDKPELPDTEWRKQFRGTAKNVGICENCLWSAEQLAFQFIVYKLNDFQSKIQQMTKDCQVGDIYCNHHNAVLLEILNELDSIKESL
jgi:Zn-finger protein